MTTERPTGATNPRLKCVRIEVGADARSYVSGDRRVTPGALDHQAPAEPQACSSRRRARR